MIALRAAALLLLLCLPLFAAERKGDKGNQGDIDDPDVCTVTIHGKLAGGPPISADDLVGRAVLIAREIQHGGDRAWKEHLIRSVNSLVDPAPPGGLAVIYATPDNNIDAALWKQMKGTPWAALMNLKDFSMGGLGGGHYVFISAEGELVCNMIIDGRDLDSKTRYASRGKVMEPDDIRRLVDSGPGSPLKGGPYKALAAEAQALAECGVTARPIAPIVKTLQAKQKAGKQPDAAEAQALLAGLAEYLGRLKAFIERTATSKPFIAWKSLERINAQLAGDPLGKPFVDQLATLKRNAGFMAEVKAAEILAATRTLCGELNFGRGDPDLTRDKTKVQTIKQNLDLLVTAHARTQAGRHAAALKERWVKWLLNGIQPIPW